MSTKANPEEAKASRTRPNPSQDKKIPSKTGIHNMKVSGGASHKPPVVAGRKTFSTFGKEQPVSKEIPKAPKPAKEVSRPTGPVIGNVKKNPAEMPAAGIRRTINPPTPIGLNQGRKSLLKKPQRKACLLGNRRTAL